MRESVYLPHKDYTRQDTREEPLKERQIEELRLVSDQTWFEAQARMAREATLRGRHAKRPDRKSRPRLLNGLLYCSVHDRPLYVGGVNGKLMQCPSCRRTALEDRPLYSYVNRRLAVDRICSKLVELLHTDDELVASIEQACLVAVESLQKPDANHLGNLEAADAKLKAAISLTRRTAGDSPEEQKEAEQEIAALQSERRVIQAELAIMQALLRQQPKLPTESEIRDLLANLRSILINAASAETDENWQLAREVIELFIDGRIELHQMGERKVHHGWLQARFKVGILKGIQQRLTGITSASDHDAVEVHIDLRRESSLDPREDVAWEMYEADKMSVEIGRALGVGKTMVLKLLRRAAAKRGVKLIDGRSRRIELSRKQQLPKKSEQIADDVKRLADKGWLFDDIARHLGVDRNLITKAWTYWHVSRELDVPDGRARRKLLEMKSRPRKPSVNPSDNDITA